MHAGPIPAYTPILYNQCPQYYPKQILITQEELNMLNKKIIKLAKENTIKMCLDKANITSIIKQYYLLKQLNTNNK